MSLPPIFALGNAFEDWAEKYWAGCVRPDEITEGIARDAFAAGEARMFNEADGAQIALLVAQEGHRHAHMTLRAKLHGALFMHGSVLTSDEVNAIVADVCGSADRCAHGVWRGDHCYKCE